MEYRYRCTCALLILTCFLCGLFRYRFNHTTEVISKESKSHLELNDSHYEAGRQRHVTNCVTRRILGKTPINLQTIPFEVSEGTSPEMADQRKSSFEYIFKRKVWLSPGELKNENQASGPGSTLLYAQEAIAALHSIIDQLKRELRVDRIRLLDIPCGDMVWVSEFLRTRDDVLYTGLDIVPDLISRHQKNYVGQSSWAFRVQDIVRDGLNESYDLILCRMMLQHLFTYDALLVIKHFSESGSRYLLATTFSHVRENPELPKERGRFRLLNLELPPFSLIPPICVVRDGEKHGGGQHHNLGLWQLPVRRVRLCNSVASFRVSGFGADFYSCTEWSS